MRIFVYGASIAALLCLLSGCDDTAKKTTAKTETIRVQRQALHKTLHFPGTVQPLQENSIISPFDAVIEAMPADYGEALEKHALAFTLTSSELQKQYNDSLTEYLKSKDSYTIATSKFQGAQELWDAGLISKNSYTSEQSTLNNARISLLQNQKKFSDLLEKMGHNPDEWGALNLTEFDKVRQALSGNNNQIQIYSPHVGILLYPPKSGEDKNARLRVGSVVKAGQVLGLIGDLNGIRVEIEVPEIDIDKIFRGMKAKISGAALGQEAIDGELIAVNGQAAPTSGNNLPVFSAVVVAKHLTTEQKKRVRVGMSANVELALDSYRQLVIPINAVQFDNGKSVVQVLSKKGEPQSRIIQTGAAMQDKVAILSGLKEGEEIVIYATNATH